MLLTANAPASPTPPAIDLSALVRGDARAFAELVDRHAPMVAGICRSVGLAGADADDAVADAFAAVFRALPGFEARSQLSTWVYRIAFRQILHEAQRQRLRRHRAGSWPSADVADHRPPAGDALDAAEQRERVWAVVHTLEPRQAMAVELFYRRGLDVAAIALVLDCPGNTVKTLLSRARQQLKIVFQQQGIEP